MKGLKYLLIVAAAYYFYKKYQAAMDAQPQPGDENTQLEAVQGIKKLPHTY
jgi:hypothetical protein